MDRSQLTDVPATVLCHVLTFLPSTDVIRTTRVCRLVHRIVFDDDGTRAQLWRDPQMVLAVPPSMPDTALIATLARIGPNMLGAIDFGRRATALSDAACEAVAANCDTSLRSVRHLRADRDAILSLLSRCRQLRRLDLDVPQMRIAESDARRQQLLLPEDSLAELERLEIGESLTSGGAPDAIDSCTALIAAAASSLRELLIKRRVACPTSLHPAMAHGTRLRRIQIRATLILDLVELLCCSEHSLPQLEEVVLAGICDLGPRTPVVATTPRPSVRKFVLSSRTLQAHGLDVLAHHFPRVRHLRLGVLERSTLHETLSAASRHFTHVERIELHLEYPRFAARHPAPICASSTVQHIAITEDAAADDSATDATRRPRQPRDAPPPPLVDAELLATCLGAFRNLQTLTYNGRLCFSRSWARERQPVLSGGGGGDSGTWESAAYPCEPLRSLVPASAILAWRHLQRCGVDRSRFAHIVEGAAINAMTIAGSAAIRRRRVLSPGPDFRDSPTIRPDILGALLLEIHQRRLDSSDTQCTGSAPAPRASGANGETAVPGSAAESCESLESKRREERRLVWAHNVMLPYVDIVQQFCDRWIDKCLPRGAAELAKQTAASRQ